MPYYQHVDQVEQVLANLESRYPGTAHRVPLPHATHEGRASSALLLSSDRSANKECVLVLGGVHANEWGSSEIAVNLATMLLSAHESNRGLGFGGSVDAAGLRSGGTQFSAQDIQRLFATRDLLLFPLVNPDGRQFVAEQAAAATSDWRKNRRPVAVQGGRAGIGVDINRNFDFVFDLTLFQPNANPVASTDPASSNYQGPGPESEAETRNVVWLLDTFKHVGWLVDLHSAGNSFCYAWNHDDGQQDRPQDHFQSNRARGRMGTPGPGTYREFLALSDLTAMRSLAARFAQDAFAVRKLLPFDTRPAYWNSAYPGTSHDYAYSRHLVDSSKSQVLGFICEWGDLNQHPPWAEMAAIIEEITAGLIGFCLQTIPAA